MQSDKTPRPPGLFIIYHVVRQSSECGVRRVAGLSISWPGLRSIRLIYFNKTIAVLIVLPFFGNSYLVAAESTIGAGGNVSYVDEYIWQEQEVFGDEINRLLANDGLSREEKAVLRSLNWLVGFAADDKNLVEVFSDALLMLSELSSADHSPEVQRVSESLLRSLLATATNRLDSIFSQSVYGFWDYTSILSMVYDSKIPLERYIEHFNSYEPHTIDPVYGNSIESALESMDYDLIGDYLIDFSFVHHLNEEYPNSVFYYSGNPYETVLSAIESVPFLHNFESDRVLYSEQNYFVTHIVLVMSDYGRKPIPSTILTQRVLSYILREFNTVRYKVDDLDLLAEFVHCLKILNSGEGEIVQEAISHMLDRQLPNGAWGSEKELTSGPYDQLHPSWAVSTSLIYQPPVR